MPLPLHLKKTVTLLKKRVPFLWGVYVFGSEATQTSNAESDIDIAILARKPLTLSLRLSLAIELEEIAGQKVDLVDLRTVPLTLIMQVLEKGQPLLVKNKNAVALFETHAMSQYCLLNEERKEIIEDIQKRGSVYGR